MKREEVFGILETLFYMSLCAVVILVFIIPGYIFRLVQDR